MSDQPGQPKLWIGILTAVVFAVAVFAVGFTAYITFFAGPTQSNLSLQEQEFTLANHKGEPMTPQSFAGKPSAVFFGYTHCPDICPTTLFEMSDIISELGETADEINFAFVTVDPERDNVELLGKYMTSFDPHIVGITGGEDEIKQLAANLGVYYRKTNEGEVYDMDHTTWIYLFDSKGDFVRTANLRSPNENLGQALRELAN